MERPELDGLRNDELKRRVVVPGTDRVTINFPAKLIESYDRCAINPAKNQVDIPYLGDHTMNRPFALIWFKGVYSNKRCHLLTGQKLSRRFDPRNYRQRFRVLFVGELTIHSPIKSMSPQH